MISLALPGKTLFSGPKIPEVAPPPPPPTREDPAIAEAQMKLRQSERRRKGRSASIIADQSDLGSVNIARPEARSSQLLGQ